MSKKKISTPTPRRKPSITRSDALRLFSIINDEGLPEETRRHIGEYASDVCTDSPLADRWNNKELFVKSFVDGWGRDTHSTRNVKKILDRLKHGDSPESIAVDFERQQKESIAKRQAEEMAQPEPRNWLSQEWRWWKIRQLTRALTGEDSDARMAAARAFRALLNELIADPNFYHVDFELQLLPSLIDIRQDIARMIGAPRSARTKPQHFKAKKGGSR